MQIQKGIVKYKNRNDIVCMYGVTEDNRQYYFLDETDSKKFSNGNRIASKALVEAIDPMVKASSIGLIDPDGNEVIPFENKSIKVVNDDIILVERAEPVSKNVLDSIALRSDPTSATKLVSTPATIKEKLNAKMGTEGRYLFNDQFSEATVYDINGNNLVDGEYYSFIGIAGGKLYFSKNTVDSEITEYSILPPEVQSDITPANDTKEIDVSDVEVSKNIVEEALNREVKSLDEDKLVDEKLDEEETEEKGEEKTLEKDTNLVEEKLDTLGEEEDNVQEEVIPTEEAVDVVSVDSSNKLESEEDKEIIEDDKEIVEEAEDVPLEMNFLDSDSKKDEDIEEEPVKNLEDDFTENIFKDSILEVDNIDVSALDDDYVEDTAIEDYKVSGRRSNRDDKIMSDVINSMSDLIKQNKKQKNEINDYKKRCDTLNDTCKKLLDFRNKMSKKIKNMEALLSDVENKNQLLEDKVRNQEEIIARQAAELDDLRNDFGNKDDLVRVLADAQILLGEDSINDKDNYYNRALN